MCGSRRSSSSTPATARRRPTCSRSGCWSWRWRGAGTSGGGRRGWHENQPLAPRARADGADLRAPAAVADGLVVHDERADQHVPAADHPRRAAPRRLPLRVPDRRLRPLVRQLDDRGRGHGGVEPRVLLVRRLRVRAHALPGLEVAAGADAGDAGRAVPAHDDPDVPADEEARADRLAGRADPALAGDAVRGLPAAAVLRLGAARDRGGGVDRRLLAAVDAGADRAAAGAAGAGDRGGADVPDRLERPHVAADRDQLLGALHAAARARDLLGRAPDAVGGGDGRQPARHAAGGDRVPARAADLHPLPDLERREGMSAPVSLERVTKVYDGEVRAVDDVSLDVAGGEFVVLVGPSGCGKSTLLRMIAGLERVTAGTVRIGGEDVTTAAPPDRDIAMVFQNYALYPHKTVAENLAFGLRQRKTPREEVARRVGEMSAMLGLEELMARRPAQLSGGQRQRGAGGGGGGGGAEVFLVGGAVVEPRRQAADHDAGGARAAARAAGDHDRVR